MCLCVSVCVVVVVVVDAITLHTCIQHVVIALIASRDADTLFAMQELTKTCQQQAQTIEQLQEQLAR